MLRLFTGLALPPSLAKRLGLMQGGVKGARWHAPENFHITLAFIGDVDEDTAERADEALSAIRADAFTLSLHGVGHFAQGKHPNVLWAGVEKSDALFHLQEKVCRALEAARIPLEKRKYAPHVTLARLKHTDTSMLAGFLQEHGLFSSAPFKVDGFNLYQSHLTKNGSDYAVLKTYPLL